MFETRRSIRKYKNIPIENEKLDIIIKNMLFSPTAHNKKPWEFIVVQNKEKIAEIAKTRAHSSAFLKDAACVIIVLGDSSLSDLWIEDTSIASYAIQLSAHEQGIGTCWVQMRLREHSEELSAADYIKERFNIPEHLEVECVIGLGYPDEDKPAHILSDKVFSKVHHESYK